jgi:hypothetical protein
MKKKKYSKVCLKCLRNLGKQLSSSPSLYKPCTNWIFLCLMMYQLCLLNDEDQMLNLPYFLLFLLSWYDKMQVTNPLS